MQGMNLSRNCLNFPLEQLWYVRELPFIFQMLFTAFKKLEETKEISKVMWGTLYVKFEKYFCSEVILLVRKTLYWNRRERAVNDISARQHLIIYARKMNITG